MGRIITTGVVFGALLLLVLGFAACSEESEGTHPDVGKLCGQDSDCPDTLVCGAENSCEECQSCQVRSDCPQGYTCDQSLGCCKMVSCTEDLDCVDPKYCLELVCRQKPCVEDEECSRERHYCNAGSCTRKECETHADCPSNICDTAAFTCRSCAIDADCPSPATQICSQGACRERSGGDDDDIIGKREGCAEFQTGCLYSRMTCFNKINPPVSYASCRRIEDEDGVEGFEFVFPDGSVWRTLGIPARYYQARGEGGFCYHIVHEYHYNRLMYYDGKDGNFLGSYSVDVTRDVVIIGCPDGSKEYYGLNALRNENCSGFQLSGIYTPPPPGVEGCGRIDEE